MTSRGETSFLAIRAANFHAGVWLIDVMKAPPRNEMQRHGWWIIVK
jgi:hypothetical protein